MDKLIIEARVNEYQSRAQNPNVPFLPAEIAADAAACRSAGAAVVHFHARQADGSPDHSAEAYADAVRRIRSASDILVHPTLGYIAQGSQPEQRLAPVMRLPDDPATRPDFAPMDTGSVNVDVYDPVAKRFRSGDQTYVNATGTLEYFARNIRGKGLKHYHAIWNLSFVRTATALMDMELVPEPAYFLLLLSGDIMLAGHPDTEAGLDAYTRNLPAHRRVVWTVCDFGGDLLPLVGKIVAEGGHVSIGLGDHPYAEYGSPTNAELVARVAEVAAKHGRGVATPAEAKAILGMD